jgi:hypothetical protein
MAQDRLYMRGLPKLVCNNSIEVEGLARALAMARLAPILAARRPLKEALATLAGITVPYGEF